MGRSALVTALLVDSGMLPKVHLIVALGDYSMPIFDTFAKRMARVRNAGKPVLFKYDELPADLRVQVVHILQDVVGIVPNSGRRIFGAVPTPVEVWWHTIHDTLAREMGVFDLGNRGEEYDVQCLNFIIHEPNFEQAMSLIEIVFRFIDTELRHIHSYKGLIYDNAINELNERFREHAVGYQYQSGYLVRVDSQYLHAETVEPALSLLYDAGFTGASDEFLDAHKHYRQGNNKDAISNALKAFESAMKTICDKRKWQYDKKRATASTLIGILFAKNLIPPDMQSHFGGLRTTLESGVPTVRNRMGGHGQGSVPVDVPDYIVPYVLHLTASNIVLLVSAYNELK